MWSIFWTQTSDAWLSLADIRVWPFSVEGPVDKGYLTWRGTVIREVYILVMFVQLKMLQLWLHYVKVFRTVAEELFVF